MAADDAQRADPGGRSPASTPRAPARARRSFTRAAGGAGLVAAVLSNAYLLAGPLGSHLDAADSLVSELEVPGQPTSGPLRLADLVCALLVVVLAAGLAYRLPRQPYLLAAALLLAVYGLASVADAAYPMPCTPSTSVACRRAVEAVSPATLVHHAHALSSAVAMSAVILAMLALSRAPAIRRQWPRTAGAGAATGVLVILLNLAQLALIAWSDHGTGVMERLLLGVISVWIVAVSLLVLRGGDGAVSVASGRTRRQRGPR